MYACVCVCVCTHTHVYVRACAPHSPRKMQFPANIQCKLSGRRCGLQQGAVEKGRRVPDPVPAAPARACCLTLFILRPLKTQAVRPRWEAVQAGGGRHHPGLQPPSGVGPTSPARLSAPDPRSAGRRREPWSLAGFLRFTGLHGHGRP